MPQLTETTDPLTQSQLDALWSRCVPESIDRRTDRLAAQRELMALYYRGVVDLGSDLKPKLVGAERSAEDHGIPMVLHCPECHLQHVDEVDPVANPGWLNPPHTSHKCLRCATVWRPCDQPTEGVRSINTRGGSDTWP